MQQTSQVIWLDDLGILRVRGADAVRFLQGQLSNDVTRVGAATSLLAGLHNPQGRTVALLRLVYWDEGDLLAVVPRELAAGVVTRLSKFVLRAKVKIIDESTAWRIGGLIGSPAELPATAGSQARAGDSVLVRVGDRRALLIAAADNPTSLSGSTVGDLDTWRRLDVEAGQPQVFAVTSEEFVAQMLNLDVLNAIAFDKGCYTGQEVIARAHYRGKVKRRMQRFISREPLRLAPGDSGQLMDGRVFKVVLAAQLEDGRCDFLAVAPLAGAEQDSTGAAAPGALTAAVAPATPAGAASAAPTVATAAALSAGISASVAADPAPLPYSLPD